MSLSRGCCTLDGGANTLVGAAAAQVTCQYVFDLNVGRFGCGFQQRARRYDHVVDAVAALHLLLINESLLKFARLAVLTQTIKSGDIFATHRADRQQARSARHTLCMYGAGTALARTATEFGAFQREIIAQCSQQTCVGVNGD